MTCSAAMWKDDDNQSLCDLEDGHAGYHHDPSGYQWNRAQPQSDPRIFCKSAWWDQEGFKHACCRVRDHLDARPLDPLFHECVCGYVKRAADEEEAQGRCSEHGQQAVAYCSMCAIEHYRDLLTMLQVTDKSIEAILTTRSAIMKKLGLDEILLDQELIYQEKARS